MGFIFGMHHRFRVRPSWQGKQVQETETTDHNAPPRPTSRDGSPGTSSTAPRICAGATLPPRSPTKGFSTCQEQGVRNKSKREGKGNRADQKEGLLERSWVRNRFLKGKRQTKSHRSFTLSPQTCLHFGHKGSPLVRRLAPLFAGRFIFLLSQSGTAR